MNMQRTIRARRANSNTKPVGRHWTVTSIVRDGKRAFGFGMDDDGTTSCYISTGLVLRHNMSEHDIGAGFTAPIRPNQGYTDAADQIVEPLTWDGDAEEIEVQEAPESSVSDAQMDELIDRCETLVTLSKAVSSIHVGGNTPAKLAAQVQTIGQTLSPVAKPELLHELQQIFTDLEAMQGILNTAYNKADEHKEWLDAEYPDGD